MDDLVIIAGDHGDHWKALPVVARAPSGIVIFLDHRMPILERIKVVEEVCPRDDRRHVEVLKLPVEADCASGLHDWEPMHRGRMIIAACCEECGEIAPFPHPLRAPQGRSAITAAAS